jgi:hypothetical protein
LSARLDDCSGHACYGRTLQLALCSHLSAGLSGTKRPSGSSASSRRIRR